MTLTKLEEALWANRVQRQCLLEAEDVETGLAATEIVLSTCIPQKYGGEEAWVTIPDSILQTNGPVPQALLSVTQPRAPDVIIHNHISAPDITVNVPPYTHPKINVDAPIVNVSLPEQKTPVVNVDAPRITVEQPKMGDVIVNVPEQKTPVVNVAAPVVNVAAPNITVEAPSANRKVSIKKDGAGSWTGEVKE